MNLSNETSTSIFDTYLSSLPTKPSSSSIYPMVSCHNRQYYIRSFLSAALYGDIYLAYDYLHHRNVVIKHLHYQHVKRHISFYQHRYIPEDIKQEAIIYRYLNTVGSHPNVLSMYDDFYYDGYLYLIFEYCLNGDFFTYLQEYAYDGLHETVAMDYWLQLLQGLDYLHKHNIAHCDISLENILIDTNMKTCKIFNFGLASKANMKSTKSNGKQLYMAPEIALGLSYDPIKTDIWALGIVLFIMLTGHPLLEVAREWDPRYRYLVKEQKLHRNPIAELLKQWTTKSVISPEIIDLLNRILQIAPLQRISIDEIYTFLLDWKAKSQKKIKVVETTTE